MKTKHLIMLAIMFGCATIFTNCSKKGCTESASCVENYNSKAKKDDGSCKGCTDAYSKDYCPEAKEDNGLCEYLRKFYTDNSWVGWIDIWVSDSTNNSASSLLRLEGRTYKYYSTVPDCASADSTVEVYRRAGDYYYKYERQDGESWSGWVEFYKGAECRLKVVY